MCYGTGANPDVLGDLCKGCLGTGLESIKCTSCNGQGLVDQQLELFVKIPKSVDNSMLLRVRGKGNEALNGQPGDLILSVNVDQDFSGFKRNRYDIHSDISITFTQAIFGCTVNVETVEGTKPLKIPPGTDHN